MDIILYNPFSSSGKNIKVANKLEKQLKKKKPNAVVEVKDLVAILDVKEFLSQYNEDDRIILLGGDGTIHRIVNAVREYAIKPEVYMYKAGTGNDFVRSIDKKSKLINVKKYLTNLPELEVNGKKELVINGAGVGLDGLVCYKVNKSKQSKNKSNYFMNTVSAFFEFKPVKANFKVDGKEFSEQKVWFASAMYAKYFGGGMKIAPNKERNDGYIELVIVKDIPKFALVFLLPTVYLGWHTIFKKWIKFYKGKSIEVDFNGNQTYLQQDGEDEYPVDKFKISI